MGGAPVLAVWDDSAMSTCQLLCTAYTGNRVHRYRHGHHAECGATVCRTYRGEWIESHWQLCGRCFTKQERHAKYLHDMGMVA